MLRTCKSIIEYFNKQVSEKRPIGAGEWLEAAQFMAVLMGDEHAKLYELEQEYMKECMKYMEMGDSNPVAEKKAKITDSYPAYKKQSSFCKQIEEFIRVAKKQASLAQAEMYSQQ